MYHFLGQQGNSDAFASSHLHLRAVAVVAGVEQDGLLSGIHESHDGAVEAFHSSVDHTYFCFVIDLPEGGLVEVGDGLRVGEGAVASDVLVGA